MKKTAPSRTLTTGSAKNPKRPQSKRRTMIDAPSTPLEPTNVLTLGQAASLLVTLCWSEDDPERRAHRNLIQNRLRYAIRHGQLNAPNGQVKVADLGQWAMTKASLRSGISKLKLPQIIGVTGLGPSDAVSPNAKLDALPATHSETHAALRAAVQKHHELEDKIKQLKKQIDDDKPYTESGRKAKKPKPRTP